MPEREEWVKLTARQAQAEQQPSHVHLQRTPGLSGRLSEITHKAQTVVDHPGWQFFLDTLESRVQHLTAEHKGLVRQMITSPALGQDLERMKIKLNKIDAELAGLRYAASVIPQAVELGHKVTEQLIVQPVQGA